METTISRLQTTIDHAPVTHLLPSHPTFSVSSHGSQSKESKDTIGDPSNSFLKEKAPSMSVRSEPSLRNSRTSMKRLDSYTVAVKKSSRISESFKKVWTKDGSHTSMQVHRQNPSRCKKLGRASLSFPRRSSIPNGPTSSLAPPFYRIRSFWVFSFSTGLRIPGPQTRPLFSS